MVGSHQEEPLGWTALEQWLVHSDETTQKIPKIHITTKLVPTMAAVYNHRKFFLYILLFKQPLVHQPLKWKLCFWNISKFFTPITIKYSMKVHIIFPLPFGLIELDQLWRIKTRLWQYFFSKTVLSAMTVMLQSDTLTCSLVFVLQHTHTPDKIPGLSCKVSHKLLNSSCCSVKSWMEFWNEQWGN